jgi:hypothetical protein
MKPRVPIDNCPHEFVEHDDVADEDYCTSCGLVFENEPGGWQDASTDDS